jgi:gluconokinase
MVTLDQASAPLVLALDMGSSSTRALLYDSRARLVDGVGAQEGYALQTDKDGASEDQPAEALARLGRCVDALLQQIGPDAARIGAVATATLASTLIGLDAAGRPLTPLLTYADTRNDADALALRRRLDERAVHQRTGSLLRTSYWPARLAWLRRARPEVWRSVARWVTLGEWVELNLFGRCRASYSAAAWTGLLDWRRLAWDAPLLETLGVAPEQLSPLVDVDEALTGLAAPFAQRWPALSGAPWLPAVGDGAAANIGSGCVGAGRVALTVGTTGALRVAIPDPPEVPEGLWLYRVDRRTALLGGATSEGGNLFAWARRTLRLGAPPELEQQLAALPPDGHGLTILPFIAGERSPGWAGNVKASIHGVTLDTSPAEITRAALEAVAYRFALIAARMPIPPEALLVASGGALRASEVWSQIVADALGRELEVSTEPEATCRGVVLLALRTLGVIPALDALPSAPGPRYTPDPARHAVYQGAIARQQQLYERIINI